VCQYITGARLGRGHQQTGDALHIVDLHGHRL
jgi:hypothetical protein